MSEYWAKWGRIGQPRPCDCGFYAPDSGLVLCDDAQRVHCHADVQARLAKYWKDRRETELRRRRVAPDPPFSSADIGHCRWCNGFLPSQKDPTKPHLTRRWHPGCLQQHYLHTRRDVQQDFLVDRDGPWCDGCGVLEGRFQRVWLERDPLVYAATRPWFQEQFPPGALTGGELTYLHWNSRLEVDHVVALGLIWDLPDEERRPFYGPENLHLLCSACHKAKTLVDCRLIREKQKADAAAAPAE